jgi:xanthine dehydrogenase large subunit
VQGNRTVPIVDELVRTSGYHERRRQIAEWNATHPHHQARDRLESGQIRHLVHATLFNQAGALVHVYTDGSVLLNHGGTEMGQGLFTKVAQVVAHEFGLPLSAIRVSATDTSKVPNTSATAASSGADLNGKAAQAAAQTIRERLVQFACERHAVAAPRRCVSPTATCRSPSSASRSPSWCSRRIGHASRCLPPATTARRKSSGTTPA